MRRPAVAVAVLLGLVFAAAGPATPAMAVGSSSGPDGVIRGQLSGDPARPPNVAPFVLALSGDVLDLSLSVESLDGSYGVSSGGQQTTVTVSADVLFAFDKADLTTAARAKIADVVAELRADHAGGQVVVGGHADHLGNPAYNQALSVRRAQTVVAALRPLLAGVNVTLLARGFGATRPLVPETKPDGSDDPEARARNRRVTVTFTHPAR
jgi:outer membrane protein OmpA-like peptidoglycan-associated protein